MRFFTITLCILILTSSFGQKNELEVLNFHFNKKDNLEFTLKNNSGSTIELFYFGDSLTKYLPCNERKHSVSDNSWTLRTPNYDPGKFKKYDLRDKGESVFFIDVNYSNSDTALIVFTYKVKTKKEFKNKSYFLSIVFKNSIIQEFSPDFETKKKFGLMDPNSLHYFKNE